MKKILMTAAIGTALLCGTMSADAACPCADKGKNPPPPPPAHHKMHKMHKEMTPEMKAEMQKRKEAMDKRLNITEEQKTQLKAIHTKSKAEIAPKIQKLSEAELELQVLQRRKFNKDVYGVATMEYVELSGKTIEQLQAEIKTLRSEIHEIKKANFEATQAVFTEEQKKELQKMRAEHKKKMKKHHKHPRTPFQEPIKK